MCPFQVSALLHAVQALLGQFKWKMLHSLMNAYLIFLTQPIEGTPFFLIVVAVVVYLFFLWTTHFLAGLLCLILILINIRKMALASQEKPAISKFCKTEGIKHPVAMFNSARRSYIQYFTLKKNIAQIFLSTQCYFWLEPILKSSVKMQVVLQIHFSTPTEVSTFLSNSDLKR